jgi:hypothetical protein
VVRLYRGSVVDPDLRIHVASFDVPGAPNYNRDNCEIARELFQSQPGVRVTYWCSISAVDSDSDERFREGYRLGFDAGSVLGK